MWGSLSKLLHLVILLHGAYIMGNYKNPLLKINVWRAEKEETPRIYVESK